MRPVKPAADAGSIMLLFGAVVLPFLFFIFATGLDISGYFREQEQARRFADDAALRAWKFLPNQTLATRAVSDIAAQYGLKPDEFQQSMQGGDLTVRVSKTFPLWFAKYFDTAVALPVHAYAVATGTAFDASILVDVSSYMAPAAGTSWGSPAEWGPARFFTDHDDLQLGAAASPETHTQHCFNPALNTLKLAASDAYEFLGNFSRNAISLAVFPSSVYELEYLRPLASGGMLPADTSGISGEADFLRYGASDINAASWCAAAAEYETDNQNYRFPEVPTNPIFNPSGTTHKIIIPGGQFPYNESYKPNLSVRESLWSATTATRPQHTNFVITQGVSELLQQSGVVRGGLAGREVKTLIVLAGGFPRDAAGNESDNALIAAIEPTAMAIREQEDIDLRIFYVIVYSEDVLGDLPKTQTHQQLLNEQISAKLYETYQANIGTKLSNRFDFQVVFVNAQTNAPSSLIGQLVRVRRNAIISQ